VLQNVQPPEINPPNPRIIVSGLNAEVQAVAGPDERN